MWQVNLSIDFLNVKSFLWKMWPWYLTLKMTLTLVLKERSYHKEYTCRIWNLYHLLSKSYGQCSSFLQTDYQINRQTDREKNYILLIYWFLGLWKSGRSGVLIRDPLVSSHMNPFPLNDTFWRPWETSLLKTLWGKEKLLLTSNFSISRSVFYPFG